MYRGEPAIDRAGSGGGNRSAGDPRRARSPRRRRATAAADLPEDADGEEEPYGEGDEGEEEEDEEEEAYIVLDVQPRRPSDSTTRVYRNDDSCGCRAVQRRPGRRRHGSGNALRILFAVAAAAFLALAVSPVSGTTNKKEEETAAPSVTEKNTVILGTRTRTGSDPGGSIDLLAALQLHNTTRQGVTQEPGLNRLKPAYNLQGEERELRLNETNFERAAALLRQVPEFTIAAALRQDEANSGTIVAFSHGNNRYLELQSSGRKDELRFHYVSRHDGTVHVETFPFRVADGAWHRVALSISGLQVELLVDCHSLYRRLLRAGAPDTNFTLPQLQLWVGQRNARHFLFKGALQDVKLIAGPHGYLSQCPQLDSSCPTCGQFSSLLNNVENLNHMLEELTHRLAAAEDRISKVEECECQKSCRANGTVHEDGATWEKDCQQCSCVHGNIECRPTPCAKVTCKHPIIPKGQCCPICLRQCLLHGTIYDHGERVSPKQCIECDCYDGSFTCQRFESDMICPPLPCPPSEQISVAEECCKFCPDVDECKQQGGSDGHHCNANTRCVNVIGSYTCECLPGYHRVDKYNCAELDECTTGHHQCDEHATCVNTAGSYYCVCKDGYTGDGYTCKPVCNQTCQNGGECVAPGRCSCRRGYIGNSCELDLDECASDLHRCHQSSTCFNMPGWYYCRCKPGYRSALHDSTQGTQCLDIDECNDLTGERRHTCHPTAKCINTEGGYECVCPPKTNLEETAEECRLSCWLKGREINNGDTWTQEENSCRKCTCQDGVITCKDLVCDCSAPGSRRNKCCPQCNPAASCRHQELHHLVFRSGERWIYQCQTCECLYGEIDCWQMECPPVTCSNPVTEEGDCCPRCEDDPCAREVHTNGTMLTVPSRPRPCSYAGIVHDSGSSWQDPHDKCTTCECKDGQLCCSYDYGCAGDLGDDKQQRPPVPAPESFVRHPSDSAVQSLVNGTPKAALPTVTGTSGTTRTITTTVTSTTSPVSSSSHYSSSFNISNEKPHDLRQDQTTGLATSRAQQRDAYYAIRSQQQQASSTTRYQQFVRDSTTSSTASGRSATTSATTARAPLATSSDDRSTSSRRSQSTNTVDRRGVATASSSSSSLSSLASSSPTLAVVLATPTIEEADRSSTSISAQIRQLVDRRKDNKKTIVLNNAT
ncbi:protein kinase C-binding protein NELL1-like isoform X2 [Cataglyphis hispanica]|uniref:protein kinase C-binding protein NELL1-like isoform X2 n=1 Tax=Cataglyphis hispanica TaxID=1086592 RepID=UPI0021805BCF|nr:protein kinase C-binding protein NELL1-like isoform X2 [Cataglyphis hispanica]